MFATSQTDQLFTNQTTLPVFALLLSASKTRSSVRVVLDDAARLSMVAK